MALLFINNKTKDDVSKAVWCSLKKLNLKFKLIERKMFGDLGRIWCKGFSIHAWISIINADKQRDGVSGV